MISLLCILYFFFVLGDVLYDTLLLGKHNLEKSLLKQHALGNKGTPGKQMVLDVPMKSASIFTPCVDLSPPSSPNLSFGEKY